MTVEQIVGILEQDVESSKQTARVLTPAGIVMAVAGVVMYFLLKGSLQTVGLVVAGVGLLCSAGGWLVAKGNAALQQDIETVRTALTKNPSDLVWGYVYEYNHKGSQLRQVKVGFKNSTLITINEDQLSDKNMEGFLQMLKQKYNPAMVLGYSPEMEFKFNNKQL